MLNQVDVDEERKGKPVAPDLGNADQGAQQVANAEQPSSEDKPGSQVQQHLGLDFLG